MREKYEVVIGLETHAQLLTKTKAFCGCSTKFGAPPNENVCPICLGHPGALPVTNKKMVEFAVRLGLAVNCEIRERSIFARKNYFYPDSPKGYQISQYEEPICENGYLEIKNENGELKKIRIKRIHMEEDAGKSIHDRGEGTLIDLNRCGSPLLEIVTEPDISSSYEAVQYMTKMRQILQYLEICDGNMEEGSLRCDANISIRLKGEKELGVKTEVKNMNSFKNVEKAIEYEIDRQVEIIEEGGKVVQETLLWNADLNQIFSMRSKEEAHDYRYFPDPDLMPVIVEENWNNEISESLPELPDAIKNRFVAEYSLPEYDADVLTTSKNLAGYFEETSKECKDYKSVSNWIMGDVLKTVNEKKIDIKNFVIPPSFLAELINLINDGSISGKIAKDVFAIMLDENKRPSQIVKEKNMGQLSDQGELEEIVKKILDKSPKEVADFLAGKEKVVGFFVGQIMRETKGKANPQLANKILRSELEKRK